MINIAIFASGSGSNAEEIIKYFKNNDGISVKLILTNKKDAFVLERAKKFNVPSVIFDRKMFYETDFVLDQLAKHHIDFIVLAGFLWLVPSNLIKEYPDRIINIHPALLPKYAGKGMYGDRVHKAVKENVDDETGITIHLVNEVYDEGRVLFQAKCKVKQTDMPEDIAKKVHDLEYKHFPRVIESVINNYNKNV